MHLCTHPTVLLNQFLVLFLHAHQNKHKVSAEGWFLERFQSFRLPALPVLVEHDLPLQQVTVNNTLGYLWVSLKNWVACCGTFYPSSSWRISSALSGTGPLRLGSVVLSRAKHLGEAWVVAMMVLCLCRQWGAILWKVGLHGVHHWSLWGCLSYCFFRRWLWN